MRSAVPPTSHGRRRSRAGGRTGETPEELLVQLDREAKARRVPKSVVVRESLETTLRWRARGRRNSCYELARDLAGSVKGLPRDLAENPKYMEGFGE
jgi:hypothetical protein